MNTIVEDFNRNVYCALGLPADDLTMEQAIQLICQKAQNDDRQVLSTININWIVNALKHRSIYEAILNSDIVTIDGRSLLWIAKIFGCPINEIVAGSSLIQELLQTKRQGSKLSIFLFGGDNGIAKGAMENINNCPGGLKAVGALNPGFGTVEQISNDDIIAAINKAHPDILLVALGAKKGAEWIERNRNHLNSKIISHLGATINFLAGTVKRAPVLLNKLGLEWIWRITQEPRLLRRYVLDGLVLLKVLLMRFPSILRLIYWRKRILRKDLEIFADIAESDESLTIKLNITGTKPLREALRNCAGAQKDIIIDFKSIEHLNNSCIGLFLLSLKYQEKNKKKLAFININRVLGMFLSCCLVWNHTSKDFSI